MKPLRLLLPALGAALVLPTTSARADFIETFDDVSTLLADDWAMINASDPIGTTGWYQGNAAVFGAHQGATDAYIAANYENTGTSGPNTISNWLVLPEMTISNGDVLTFWTRTASLSDYPDRLQLRLSDAGASLDVGTGSTTGDFDMLLLDVNPTLGIGGFPEAWTQYSVEVSGLAGPVQGRLAFRYFVTDAGPFGNNSNYLGIDTVAYTAVPAPAGLALLGLAGLCGRRRRRA